MRADLINAIRDVRATYPAVDMGNRATFLRNLVFMHNVISASENLLEVAARESAGALRAYYLAHLNEERSHEQWLADDLKSAGVNVTSALISPEAAAMAGSQYYLIYHVDPVALLGYIAVLECFPAADADISALEKIHGKSLCRTVRYHATHDVDHGDDVLDEIDKLSGRQFQLVMQNAVQTAAYIGSAISKFEVQ